MIPGSTPKPERQNQRERAPGIDYIDVPDVPYKGAPPLPTDTDWLIPTQNWWGRISRMPHCVLWTDGDWEFALTTARMFDKFILGVNSMAPSLMRRERAMGVTHEARRDMRIRYVDPNALPATEEDDEREPDNVSALNDYRRMVDSG